MTKIKFGTDGWRAIIGREFTTENLTRITEGTVAWLKNHYEEPQIMLGYDCRFNGKMFAEWVANVFASNGVKVFISPSFASTPMVSLATNKRQCSAGIVITASHNPPEWSGYKVKGEYGGPAYPEILDEIEGAIPDAVTPYENRFTEFVDSRMIEYFDMESVYINHIRDNFDIEAIRKSGLKIGYDAMWGAGRKVFKKLLPDAEVLHGGNNPGFEGVAPEPIARNLGEFAEYVQSNGIDVGLATDGDADRIGIMDKNGSFVDSHHVLLLLIDYMKNGKGMDGKVVFTASCTNKIGKMADLLGLPFEVTKVGFKYICKIMLEENVLVGGEESGGIAIAGHVPERDGIYIGLTIVEMMAKSGKSLSELIAGIYDQVGAFKYDRNDLHLDEAKKQAVIAACKAGAFKDFGSDYAVESVDDLDGWKFVLPNEQWLMIRPSGTEPVLRIYAESSDAEAVGRLLESAVSRIKEVAEGAPV